MTQVSLLILDDNKASFDLIGHYLEASRLMSYTVHHSPSVKEALNLSVDRSVDIISVNMEMLHEPGSAPLAAIRSRYPRAALVTVCQNESSPEQALEIIKNGGQYCIHVHEFSSQFLDRTYAFAYQQKQNELRREEETQLEMSKLARAVAQSSNTIVITDKEGNITYVNDAFSDITGYTREEAIGQNPSILKSGLHDEGFYRHMWSLLSEGNTWSGELTNKRKNGEIYWEKATIDPILDVDGKIISYIAVKEDITDRRIAEEQLQKSEEHYRFLAESLNHVVWTASARGRINYVNENGLRILGYDLADLMDDNWLSIVHPDEQAAVARNGRLPSVAVSLTAKSNDSK